MSKFKKSTLFVAASILAVSGMALASPKADTDGDGQITRAEFQAASDATFAKADTDFDGNLTKDEMRALKELKKAEHAENKFDRQDLNGDGAVTKAEMEAARSEHKAKREAKRLEKFDTNNDGVVDDAEKATAKATAKAKWQAKRESRGYGSGNKGKGEKRGVRGANPDANGDGLISKAEYDAASDALFTRLDANNDGVLTKGEGRKRRGRKGKRKH